MDGSPPRKKFYAGWRKIRTGFSMERYADRETAIRHRPPRPRAVAITPRQARWIEAIASRVDERHYCGITVARRRYTTTRRRNAEIYLTCLLLELGRTECARRFGIPPSTARYAMAEGRRAIEEVKAAGKFDDLLYLLQEADHDDD